MWRNGTGHKAERSTGPRKHADLGARTAAQHKQGKSIQQDGPKMTHRAMAVQERAAERAEWREQMRLEAGPADAQRQRILAIADRRAEVQRQRQARSERRNNNSTDAASDEEDGDSAAVADSSEPQVLELTEEEERLLREYQRERTGDTVRQAVRSRKQAARHDTRTTALKETKAVGENYAKTAILVVVGVIVLAVAASFIS